MTTSNKTTIYTWNENCVMAGRVVSQSEVDRRTDGEGEVSDGDWTAWTGADEAEILRDAKSGLKTGSPFMQRCARAVIESLS